MFVTSAAAEGPATTGSHRGCGQWLYLHRVPSTRVSRRPRPYTAAGPVWKRQVAPTLRRTNPGRGQPAGGAGRRLFPITSTGAGGVGELPGRDVGPGSGAGMRGRDAGPGHPALPEPRSRLTARLPLSRLVTGARGQSPSSRPAPPHDNWLGCPQPSANPGSRCSLRQRQQLWQLRSAPPTPRACSAAAAPWRPASRGTYHLRCAPQYGRYTTKRRREK